MMRIPRFSHEQLDEIGDLYGTTVLLNHHRDAYYYTLIGHAKTAIGLRFGDTGSKLIVYATKEEPFPHPVHPEIIVPAMNRHNWMRTEHIEEPFQASLYVRPHQLLSLPGHPDQIIEKRRLFNAQNRRCFYCGELMKFWDSTIDHKIPRDRGGGDMPDNHAIACKQCNSAKGCMTVEEYKAHLNRKSLMNRRKYLV